MSTRSTQPEVVDHRGRKKTGVMEDKKLEVEETGSSSTVERV
jgi:hypothetical protein